MTSARVAGTRPEATPSGELVARVRRAGLRREAIIVGALLAVIVTAAAVSLVLDTGLDLRQLLVTLAGQGDRGDAFVLFRLRLPRIALAVLLGLAFGLAGALLQSVARNPLASPDILGISGGATIGAVSALLLAGASGPVVGLSAFAGAAVAALAIVLLAWDQGLSGYRFVLVGIAIAFLASAVVEYLLSRARLQEAQAALVWIVGSVAGARADEVATIAIALVVLIPVTAWLAPRLRQLQLGDDAARSLGVRADAARLGVLAVSVALAAAGTSVAGPVAFVAFVSAPLARSMVGGGRLALVPAALTGAALVLVADLTGQRLLPGDLQVPVGIVTAAIGAPYLLVLLALGNRRGGRA